MRRRAPDEGMAPGLDATAVEHVAFEPAALDVVLSHVRSGFARARRHEVLGLLFGRVGRDSVCRVLRAVPYQTPHRTSTLVAPNPRAWGRRTAQLARRYGLRYLGAYHSHPQLRGERTPPYRSVEDDDWLRRDRAATIDLLVRIWLQGRPPARRWRDSWWGFLPQAVRRARRKRPRGEAVEISCCGIEEFEIVTIPIRRWEAAAPRRPRRPYQRW